MRAAAAICGAVVRHSICSVALVASSLLDCCVCLLSFLFPFFLAQLLFSCLIAFCFAPAVGSGALPAGVELLVLTLTI
ncbi:hypothetical protein M440DRAFT_1400857 [Trichoderma longibrachiatum ATCC 18648]|uniref:Uncharacterized protein n=1 Tax=Trichoderma longibrachiatum ATCC 18648 TaxID=983965 RepID=A0A2T4C8L9_TRILO|nr:hypothetical protein M440DRAFT_1400857 [Trichoderma longibrachiatum ATCC 18648]